MKSTLGPKIETQCLQSTHKRKANKPEKCLAIDLDEDGCLYDDDDDDGDGGGDDGGGK